LPNLTEENFGRKTFDQNRRKFGRKNHLTEKTLSEKKLGKINIQSYFKRKIERPETAIIINDEAWNK